MSSRAGLACRRTCLHLPHPASEDRLLPGTIADGSSWCMGSLGDEVDDAVPAGLTLIQVQDTKKNAGRPNRESMFAANAFSAAFGLSPPVHGVHETVRAGRVRRIRPRVRIRTTVARLDELAPSSLMRGEARGDGRGGRGGIVLRAYCFHVIRPAPTSRREGGPRKQAALEAVGSRSLWLFETHPELAESRGCKSRELKAR